jgi:hypothetical protein
MDPYAIPGFLLFGQLKAMVQFNLRPDDLKRIQGSADNYESHLHLRQNPKMAMVRPPPLTQGSYDDAERRRPEKKREGQGYGAARMRTRASGVVEGCAVSNEEGLTSRKK